MVSTKLPTEVVSKKGSFSCTTPKREPMPRTWFLSRGYSKADPVYINSYTLWLHPVTNDVLNQYGQKIKLRLLPKEKFKKNTTRYLTFSRDYGSMYLARLKYLTFKGEIPKGYTIDHIDGNTLNNIIRNLRAVPRAINDRDGGFMRKLRNKGIRPELFSGALLGYYERMAVFKASHSRYEYERLTREDLMRLLVGPEFTIVSPDVILDLDFKTHREF